MNVDVEYSRLRGDSTVAYIRLRRAVVGMLARSRKCGVFSLSIDWHTDGVSMNGDICKLSSVG